MESTSNALILTEMCTISVMTKFAGIKNTCLKVDERWSFICDGRVRVEAVYARLYLTVLLIIRHLDFDRYLLSSAHCMHGTVQLANHSVVGGDSPGLAERAQGARPWGGGISSHPTAKRGREEGLGIHHAAALCMSSFDQSSPKPGPPTKSCWGLEWALERWMGMALGTLRSVKVE